MMIQVVLGRLLTNELQVVEHLHGVGAPVHAVDDIYKRDVDC